MFINKIFYSLSLGWVDINPNDLIPPTPARRSSLLKLFPVAESKDIDIDVDCIDNGVEEKNVSDNANNNNDQKNSGTIKPSFNNTNPTSTVATSPSSTSTTPKPALSSSQSPKSSSSNQPQSSTSPQQISTPSQQQKKVETNIDEDDEDIVITPVMKKSSAGCVPGGFCIVS